MPRPVCPYDTMSSCAGECAECPPESIDSCASGAAPDTRIGTIYYDSEAGEYVMPPDFAGDEELRWKAPAISSPPRVLSLDDQLALFEARWESVVAKLRQDLTQPAYLRHIHDLARKRLIAGYGTYGDEMYRWGTACRRANMDEELADYICYGTSEEP